MIVVLQEPLYMKIEEPVEKALRVVTGPCCERTNRPVSTSIVPRNVV